MPLSKKMIYARDAFIGGVWSGNFHLTVELVKCGSNKDACSKEENIDKSAGKGYGEALKRNNHDGCCNDDS